jgi:hypothetical protein
MSPDDLRAHFAAQAPTEIPSWFQPAMDHLSIPSLPERSSSDKDDNAAVKVWSDQKHQTNLLREQYRYFTWRWYYADQMIAHAATAISLQPHHP